MSRAAGNPTVVQATSLPVMKKILLLAVVLGIGFFAAQKLRSS